MSKYWQYLKNPTALIQKINERTFERFSLLLNSYPKWTQCNICQWSGRRMRSDSWHKYCICPSCGSQLRHRLLIASLEHVGALEYPISVKGKRVLHFSPEAAVEKAVRPTALTYRAAYYQWGTGGEDIDITNLAQFRNGDVDVVIACDVLEHIADDMLAIHEVWRVLSGGGVAIFTVPQEDGLTRTREDLTIVDPKERQKHYGQEDHVRMYGADFVDRLQLAGFETTVISERDFDPARVERYVLFPPILSKHPLATNFRKIFFARKPQRMAQN